MSVTIHWKRTDVAERYFKSGTSTDLDILKRAFGYTIGKGNIPELRAMSFLGGAFYEEVAEIVEANGEIEFWGKW